MTSAISSSNPSTGSISLSGLLGGTAGQIDTTSLIASLMQAAAIPQQQLQTQLGTQQSYMTAYQAINTKVTTMQTAAQALTDPTAWKATTASASDTSVIATSTGSAIAGSTTFNVTKTATAQISTVAADSSGNVVSNPSAGITLTDGAGNAHAISLTSGSAADVAAAINQANIGIRAMAVTTDTGTVLQLAATSTGTNAAFTATGFESAPQSVVPAGNAQISVGDPTAGGYTISSQSNTFTNAIAGVTFTVSQPATNVTIGVTSDESGIATKVQALVDAANVSRSEVSMDTAQGSPLQGTAQLNDLLLAIGNSISNGTSTGGSLSTYGLDVDKNGVITFDSTAFAAAYSADPAGTQSAVTGFASSLNTTAGSAIDPISGSVTSAITTITTAEGSLNTEITSWTSRLQDIQSNLQTKYNAMETALAKLQSQGTYLTSMLNAINNSNSSSSSSH